MKLLKDFKAFALRGNVIDMAVGVMIGGAFGKIVTSLVNDVFMPLLGMVVGQINLSGLTLQVGDVTLGYGLFLQTVLDFLLMAICVFVFIRLIAHVKPKKEAPPAPQPRLCPYCFQPVNDQATRCPHCTSVLEKPAA